jgi:hypothetical protein
MSNTKILITLGVIIALILISGGAVAVYNAGKKSNDVKTSEMHEVVNKRPAKTKPSTDKSTWFIKDYVGRNASDSCSYRLNSECMEDYGDATLTIKFVTEDGSKVSKENVNNYIVTDQSVAPDTQLTLVFAEGYDYVESQNIEEIVLNVKPINKSN